jgi:hypothetical protein
LEEYRKRLLSINEICKQNGICLVLITQPVLWGDVVDPSTGASLSSLKISDDMNGKLYNAVLELYNDEARKISRESGIALIDLSEYLKKDSEYFYDGYHFTNKGSEAVGNILARGVVYIIKRTKNRL